MRAAIVVVLIVAAAAGAWFLLGRGDGVEERGDAVERAPRGAGGEDLVTLRGREGAVVGEAPTPRDPASPVGPEHAAPVEVGRIVLHGEIRGLDAVGPGDTQVQVFPVAGMWTDHEAEPASCIAGIDGRFTLDLTPLFAASGDLTHVEIVVDHPACVQAVTRVDVTAARRAGRGKLEATITVRPGLAVIGEVLDENDGPILGADVALFAMGEDIPVYEHILPAQPLAQDRSDEEGRYRLRVARPGRYLVVAVSEGRQPAGRELRLATGAELEVASLVLVPGVQVAGRLLYQGQGVEQASVSAEPTDDEVGLPLQVGDRQVHWSPGTVLRSGGEGTTGDAGAFRVVGLSPGTHRVSVWSVSLPGVDDVSPALSNRLGGKLEAPAEGAVIEIEGALIELCTTHAGRVVGGVGLQVSASGSSSMWETRGHGGALRILVPAGVELAVRVVDDRYQSTTTTATSGTVGSSVRQEVRLVEAVSRPRLLVTFEGPGAGALEQAWFQVVPRAAATPSGSGAAPPVPAPPTATLNVENVEPGTFRVTGMPPGSSTLIVRPGTGFWEDAGYHLEIRKDVVLPAEGELAVRLTLRTGGRLKIAARDASGALLEADCVIRDAHGAEQVVTFSTQSEHVAMTQGGVLGGLSPSLVAPPLPAGRYTIELAYDGYESQTVGAEVKAGETTEVDVVLVEH